MLLRKASLSNYPGPARDRRQVNHRVIAGELENCARRRPMHKDIFSLLLAALVHRESQ